jgi:hypothetical protein
VFFDLVERAPVVAGVEQTIWLNVIERGQQDEGTLSVMQYHVCVFSLQDKDEDLLVEVVDEVRELLIDLDQTDGLKRVPMYDKGWNNTHHAVVVLGNSLLTSTMDSGIKAKIVSFSLRWGAK